MWAEVTEGKKWMWGKPKRGHLYVSQIRFTLICFIIFNRLYKALLYLPCAVWNTRMLYCLMLFMQTMQTADNWEGNMTRTAVSSLIHTNGTCDGAVPVWESLAVSNLHLKVVVVEGQQYSDPLLKTSNTTMGKDSITSKNHALKILLKCTYILSAKSTELLNLFTCSAEKCPLWLMYYIIIYLYDIMKLLIILHHCVKSILLL